MSNQPIRQMLYQGATTRIIAHDMPWFDGHTHTVDPTRMPTYRSNDPVAIKTKLSNLKAAGVNVISPNWYGPHNTFIDQSTQNYRDRCVELGLQLAIDIDGAAFTDLASLRAVVAYAKSTYCTSSCYEKYNGKYLFTVFAKSSNNPSWFRTIESENPDCIFVYYGDSTAHNQMAWVNHDLQSNLDWWIRTYGLRHDGSLNIPCVAAGFNDLNSQTGIGVWGADPARIWPPGIGQNLQTWLSYWATINNYFNVNNQLSYLQLVTVGDRDEGTDLYQPIPVVPGVATFLPIPVTPQNTRLEVWLDGKKVYEQSLSGAQAATTQQVDQTDKVLGKTTLALK